MSLLNRITKAVIDEVTKPSSFAKGEEFEKYVRDVVFIKENFKILHRSHNYQTNKGDYVENSLLPDFELQCLETKRKFHLEVKFRKGVYNRNNKIQWCNPHQLKRYKAIDKEQKVFIILGIGDHPSEPDEVFIIPISSLKTCDISDSVLDKYSFYLDKPIFNSHLWKLK